MLSLFETPPVKVGSPFHFNGGNITLNYSLHTIPCVGIKATYGGKSFVYSADHCNMSQVFNRIHGEGAMTNARRDVLLNFPWDCDVVFHEAGVPPIHTPLSELENLADDIKDHMYLIHVSENSVPSDKGFKIARAGVRNTIRIPITNAPPLAPALHTLQFLQEVLFFEDFPLPMSTELLQVITYRRYNRDDQILTPGSNSTMYIVTQGLAMQTIKLPKALKESRDMVEQVALMAGDFFGEEALLDGRSKRTVTAVTSVEVMCINASACKDMTGHDSITRLRAMSELQQYGIAETITKNQVLCGLTPSQSAYLQSVIQHSHVNAGEVIWFVFVLPLFSLFSLFTFFPFFPFFSLSVYFSNGKVSREKLNIMSTHEQFFPVFSSFFAKSFPSLFAVLCSPINSS